MPTIQEAVEKARAAGHAKRGRCSMCAVGDRPTGGKHRGVYHCGNADPCVVCVGVLPPGEQCRACGRINMEGHYGQSVGAFG